MTAFANRYGACKDAHERVRHCLSKQKRRVLGYVSRSASPGTRRNKRPERGFAPKIPR